MSLSLKPQHLKRYKDAGRLLLKYGSTDFVRDPRMASDPEETVLPQAADDESAKRKADELADDLERLGPTYIKLGQLLSTRADLLPPAYLDSLARLQDDVEPFDFEDVERIVKEELGVRISKAFLEFESQPVAAASLGQVHRAILRNGQSVAVKVQRPNIRKRIAEDLDAFNDLAEFLDSHTDIGRLYQFERMFEEFRRSLLEELDYQREAANLTRLADNLAEYRRLIVPRPIEDFCSSRVLTMEYVAGRKVTDITGLARTEIQATPLLDELLEAYLKQVVVDGFFHADPHPGNVFLTDDGRIGLIDLGMVARIGPARQEQILKLLLALSDGAGEESADAALKMAEPLEHFDEAGFRRSIVDLVRQHQDATIDQIQVGRIVMQLTALTTKHGARAPAELTMLGKTLLNLDEIARTLDPDFDPNRAVQRHAAKLLQRRMLKSLSPANVMAGAMEMKDFLNALPDRANTILARLANNEFEIKVDAVDEQNLTEGFQKIANRIATGLVLAALIVGAAMLMQVETDFTLFGYPGFAMICFLVAAAGGVVLIAEILLHDRSA